MGVLWGCASVSTLSQAERAKLDPGLIRLLEGEAGSNDTYDVSLRANGEREYNVILRCSHPDELRSAGIRIGSVFGDVVTARLTISELRKAVALQSVKAVQNSSTTYPQ
jgi:hypothetical protein